MDLHVAAGACPWIFRSRGRQPMETVQLTQLDVPQTSRASCANWPIPVAAGTSPWISTRWRGRLRGRGAVTSPPLGEYKLDGVPMTCIGGFLRPGAGGAVVLDCALTMEEGLPKKEHAPGIVLLGALTEQGDGERFVPVLSLPQHGHDPSVSQ